MVSPAVDRAAKNLCREEVAYAFTMKGKRRKFRVSSSDEQQFGECPCP